jgi:ABC-type branched-subunit amino acid transport system substrate-binding protein
VITASGMRASVVSAAIVEAGQTTAGKVAATEPSYNAQCLAMKKAAVDTLQVASAAPVVTRVVDQCAKLGFKPRTVNQTTTYATN